jgi:hypothetical protein
MTKSTFESEKKTDSIPQKIMARVIPIERQISNSDSQ